MALICPVCSADNREGANFCKQCGGPLASAAPGPRPAPAPRSRSEREWAATAPAQLRAPTMPGALFEEGGARVAFGTSTAIGAGEQTVILGTGAARRPSERPRESREQRAARRAAAQAAGTEAKQRRPKEKPPLRSRVLGLWLALLAVALVMIVAGWYGYGKGTRVEEAAVDTPAAAAPAVAPAASPAPPAALPDSAAAPDGLGMETAVAAAEPAPPSAPPAAPKPAAGTAKSRKPAAAAPAQPDQPAPAPAPAVAAPVPSAAPAAPAEPMALCGDRNFIARAQCMAAQCLKPEFKPHAQCEAVRRQQRLEEEKRNPTLLN